MLIWKDRSRFCSSCASTDGWTELNWFWMKETRASDLIKLCQLAVAHCHFLRSLVVCVCVCDGPFLDPSTNPHSWKKWERAIRKGGLGFIIATIICMQGNCQKYKIETGRKNLNNSFSVWMNVSRHFKSQETALRLREKVWHTMPFTLIPY